MPSTASSSARTAIPAKCEVWLAEPPDAETPFVRARVISVNETESLATCSAGDRVLTVPLSRCWRANPVGFDVDDCAHLIFLHEAALLENVRARYARHVVHTSAAPRVLVALNPNAPLPYEYATARMEEYMRCTDGSLARAPPHLFALAEAAYRGVVRHGTPASIVLTGESGAGKTEGTKHLLRYLSWRGGHAAGDAEQSVASRVLHSTPVFEAFGNAATRHNANSSRFGKHLELVLTPAGQVDGAKMRTYLLERTRVVARAPVGAGGPGEAAGDALFHIFYYLGASGLLPGGRSAESFRAPGRQQGRQQGQQQQGQQQGQGQPQAGVDESADDAQQRRRRQRQQQQEEEDARQQEQLLQRARAGRLAELREALSRLQVSPAVQDDVWRLLGGIMLLGEVALREEGADGEGDGACAPVGDVAAAEEALGCAGLCDSLASQPMASPRGGSVYRLRLGVRRAAAARDTLCAELYCALFDGLVAKANSALVGAADAGGADASGAAARAGGGRRRPPCGVSMLDLFGFECLETNSFEQVWNARVTKTRAPSPCSPLPLPPLPAAVHQLRERGAAALLRGVRLPRGGGAARGGGRELGARRDELPRHGRRARAPRGASGGRLPPS